MRIRSISPVARRLLVPIALSVTAAFAQSPFTEHTLKLDDDAAPVTASIEDAAWHTGRGSGEGLGGAIEEHWATPAGGAMVGMFRLVGDDGPAFYELFALAEHEGGLILRLKHFHPDMRGWEEQDRTVDFPLVAKTEDELRFDGLTYRRDGSDAITVFLAMHGKDGGAREVTFRLNRLP